MSNYHSKTLSTSPQRARICTTLTLKLCGKTSFFKGFLERNILFEISFFYYLKNINKDFYFRWPKLLDEYSSFIAKIQEATIDWKQEAKNSIKIRELVWEKLTGMSKNHFGKKLLPPNELPEFKALCDSAINPLMYLSIIDELLQILNDGKE